MGIFDGLLGRNKPTAIKQQSGVVGYFGVDSYRGRSMGYADLATEGYLKNAIVYRCVNEIAKGASAVPLRLKSGDEVIESHPIMELLNRPNPLQSYSEFFNAAFGYLLLGGNSYILRVGGATPRELHLLRPDRIEIKTGSGVLPYAYDYRVEGRLKESYIVDQETGFSELKQVKLWHPLNDYYGCSPLSAAAMEVDQHNAVTKHNISLLQNGARPSGAVVFKPKDDAGYAVQLSDSQRQQLMTDLNSRFAGSNNAGRPMLLEGDFDWKEMGLSPKDMDFINLKHMSATDIAMCFGVPSQLVGVPDSQTYSNVAEARLALYEETIIPYLRKMESDLNEWLIPQFGEGVYVEYDVDSIPALSERRRRIYENVLGAVSQGIMTRNEAREMIGLSPMQGADDLLVPANLFPINEGSPDDTDNVEDEEDLDFFDDEDEKALSDIDLLPTASMREQAQQGLDLRKEFNRGGTSVGVARARDIINGRSMSVSTVKRMYSFFARHAVDEEAQGWRRGEEGYPSAGLIAHKLWGGDAGRSWAGRKRAEIAKEEGDKSEDLSILDDHIAVPDSKARASLTLEVSDKVKEALRSKVDDHNDKVGDNPAKRATLRMLSASFNRGVGAYRTNPQSVRPNVTGPDQWAYARVNSLLFALRNGRFRSGKHDTDLLPEGHPLSSKS